MDGASPFTNDSSGFSAISAIFSLVLVEGGGLGGGGSIVPFFSSFRLPDLETGSSTFTSSPVAIDAIGNSKTILHLVHDLSSMGPIGYAYLGY